VHSIYGHTAIRVIDPAYNYDAVFNYGVFNFDGPNFIYRFAKGETDYMLYAYPFNSFYESYKKDKRSIFEQELNLTTKEKQQLFDFLIWNTRKENREYRYNFFFDNCASRVRDVVEKQIDGKILFPEKSKNPKTFRRLIKDYHSIDHWLNFGVDLVVCAPADRLATSYEEMFLPDYLMDHFANAKVKTTETERPLVGNTKTIYQAPPKDNSSFSLTTPFIVFGLVFHFFMFLSFYQFRKNKNYNWPDYLVYGFNGLMGVILLWFVMYSEHPAMSPNYNLIWAMPLNLLFAVVWMIKKWRPITRYYHVFVSVWMLLFILIGQFLPQHFHIVFYFIVLMVLSRSLMHTALIFKKHA